MSTSTRGLNDGIDQNSPERVRYLPQSFFEKLTNDLEGSKFKETLEDIVFSNLPDIEKLGKTSFKDLIKFKNESLNNEIESLEQDIADINKKLIDLEQKHHPDYIEQQENSLAEKKKELKAFNSTKPIEVVNPDTNTKIKTQVGKDATEIDKLTAKKDKVKKDIDDNNTKLEHLTRESKELENTIDLFISFKKDIKVFIEKQKKLLSKFNLKPSNILTYSFNLSGLEEALKSKQEDITSIEKLLATKEIIQSIVISKDRESTEKNSLYLKLAEITTNLTVLTKKLSEPKRKYQEHIEELKVWEKRKANIIGDISNHGTIEWFEKEIEYLTHLTHPKPSQPSND